MKIAIIRPDCNVLPRKFYNSQELGLATHLSELGVSVDVYYAGHVEKVEYEEIEHSAQQQAKVRLIQLPFWEFPLIGQGYYPSLTSELKKETYDLIQVNEYNDIINFIAIRYAAQNNIPRIIYQGMYKNMTGRVNQLYTYLHDLLMLPYVKKKVQNTYSKTKKAAQFLSDKGFKNCGVLPIGLDPSPFNLNNETPNIYRAKFNIPSNHKVITYIGIFESRRNIAFLLELASSLKDEDISFLFVGSGELYVHAQSYCEEKELKNVRLVGQVPQNQISDIYNLSDIFLLASDYEIYGMVLIEAMYHGVAVITNNTAGSESLIESEKTGIIIDELNVSKWSASILNLCSDDDKLMTLKANAQTKINKYLLWEKVAIQYKNDILSPLVEASKC